MKHTAKKGRHQPANAPRGAGTTPSKIKRPPRVAPARSARSSKTESTSVFVTTAFEPALSLDEVADFPAPEDMEEQIFDKDCIRKYLALLTIKEELVIRLRYGLGDHSPETCKEIGEQFGLSANRISQIEKKALRRLRYFAMTQPLRLPNSDLDRLCGMKKPWEYVVPDKPVKFEPFNVFEAEKEHAVPVPSPRSRKRPPRSSKAGRNLVPCKKPQHQGAPSHLRPWPLHIALFLACCAPFAILDLILVSEAARTLLAAVVGKWVTAALVILACYIFIVPAALLEDFVCRGRGA
jgi:RNA polymerase sigma factor (sigma-70 family)